MKGSTIAILMGIFIVIAGIALTSLQMIESNGKDIKEYNFKLISAEAGSSKLQVETDFLGAPLVILGMILFTIGAIISRANY